jgi:hypothetical protein
MSQHAKTAATEQESRERVALFSNMDISFYFRSLVGPTGGIVFADTWRVKPHRLLKL